MYVGNKSDIGYLLDNTVCVSVADSTKGDTVVNSSLCQLPSDL